MHICKDKSCLILSHGQEPQSHHYRQQMKHEGWGSWECLLKTMKWQCLTIPQCKIYSFCKCQLNFFERVDIALVWIFAADKLCKIYKTNCLILQGGRNYHLDIDCVSIVSRCQKKNAQPRDASITSRCVEKKTNRRILFFDTIEVLCDENVRLVVPPSWSGEEDLLGCIPTICALHHQ